MPETRRLCFAVNPLAGIGGPLALKGSDGRAGLEALKRGARLVAPERARRFVKELVRIVRSKESLPEFFTAEGLMGSKYLEEAAIPHRVVYRPKGWPTSREDTLLLLESCLRNPIDLVVFVGGDGTARDVASVVDERVPILGVPSGVKMYSAVFAETPEAAAHAVLDWLHGRASTCEAEVLDIDEEAFRKGVLRVKLYGYVRSLCGPGVVAVSKQPTSLESEDVKENIEAIARYVVENMEDCVLYVLGPGHTVAAIAQVLDVEKTLLGVDVVHNKKVVARDVDEERLYELVRRHRERGGRVRIVLSPIGGQGFILGRGNQQISPRVIREAGGKHALLVVAPHAKLRRTPVLRVDTGDPALDQELTGYIRVVTDYGEEALVKIERLPEPG